MRIGRTIPPASTPLSLQDILNGCRGLARGEREVERFRREIQEYFAVRHCFLVSSGKAALAVILQALQARRPGRREVLIPAFGCYSIPSAVRRAGLSLRLCDVDPRTLDYDFDELRRCLDAAAGRGGRRRAGGAAGPALLAAVSVHLFGKPADTVRLRELIADPEVAVVEDAAQAMGAESRGRRLGLRGDVGFFSLGRGKAWTTGEGGVIVTDRDDIADAIRRRVAALPGYGPMALLGLVLRTAALAGLQRPSFFWIPRLIPFLRVGDTIYDPGFPMRRLSGFQAGLARRWPQRLGAFRSRRRRCIARWEKLPLAAGVSRYPAGAEPVDYLRYPLRVRPPALWEKILERSLAGGVGVMLTYPDSIDRIPDLRDALDGREYPAARRLAREILTLPVHPLLTDKDCEKISRLIASLGATSPESRDATSVSDGLTGLGRGVS